MLRKHNKVENALFLLIIIILVEILRSNTLALSLDLILCLFFAKNNLNVLWQKFCSFI